jgi:hypothetical protein
MQLAVYSSANAPFMQHSVMGEHMIKQPWWRSTNRTILALTLLLCVAAAVGGAYLLGLLDLFGLLP